MQQSSLNTYFISSEIFIASFSKQKALQLFIIQKKKILKTH